MFACACTASSGVWGNNRCFDAPRDSTVTDEDLQAQAWVPNCLTAMLVEVNAHFLQSSCACCKQILCRGARFLLILQGWAGKAAKEANTLTPFLCFLGGEGGGSDVELGGWRGL